MSIFLLLGLAVVLAIYLRWVSPGRVLLSLGARPLDQSSVQRNIRARMKAIAYRQRMRMPTLWILPEFTPNALILRPSRRRLHVALTEGLVRTLSGEELDSILALCLTHGYQRGRISQSWVAAFFYPITRFVQSYPLPAQFLLAPLFSFFFRIASGPGRFMRSDLEAARHQSPWVLAASLQKLSVLGAKIPLRNWNMALDSLFLVSPMALDESLFWVFLSQPSVERRRECLLSGLSCENSPALT
jgi:Zn-dependent protease with chaperone function